MKKLLAQRYVVRRNWLSIFAFCLMGYFCYHALLGDRSYIRLIGLERQIAKVSEEYQDLSQRRGSLEARVVRLRPGSIDRDLLEERAQHVLGYYRAGSHILAP